MASVHRCRDKSLSKALWKKNNVDCPPFAPIAAPEDLVSFFIQQEVPIVLKPASGSGSELVYLCESLSSCEEAYRTVSGELERRKEKRLYSGTAAPMPLLAEAMVAGREYSCDFIWTGNEVKMIRVAEKIRKPAAPFGTIGGYLLPASLPGAVSGEALASVLANASRALGLTRAICMADFILKNGRIFMLEMAPRPGGDCLPFMLRYAPGVDMLALAVDFAAGRPAAIPVPTEKGVFMGVRVHAPKPGILGHVGLENGGGEFKILETHFIRNPGHRIQMPPADYESWFLGHLIVELEGGKDPNLEYQRVCSRLHIEIEEGKKGNGHDRRAAF
jgi:biotin carboxylase